MTNESYFTFWVFYRQTTFREIKQIRAYDLDMLYGNIGGYMGLLLGYAILNLPTMLLFLYGSIKKSLLNIKTTKPRAKQTEPVSGFLSNHIMMMLGTTTIMMHTMHNKEAQEKREGSEEDKYEKAITKLEKRIRSIEEKLK